MNFSVSKIMHYHATHTGMHLLKVTYKSCSWVDKAVFMRTCILLNEKKKVPACIKTNSQFLRLPMQKIFSFECMNIFPDPTNRLFFENVRY